MKQTFLSNILESDLIRLEPLDEKHFSSLSEIAVSQPHLLQFSPSPFGSAEALRLYFNEAFVAHEKETRQPFAIFNKKTQTYVGSTSYGNYSEKDQRVKIG